MTDVHSHILFDLDDGARTIDESIELLIKLKNIGFDNIIITPHYIDGSKYEANNELKNTRFKILNDEIKKRNLDIKIYLGNEIFINSHVIKDITNKKASTLNNTKYFLFEVPFRNKILNFQDIIHEMKCQGYIPVLAHPERYTYFQKDYKLVDKLKEDGLLFQANFSSITGFYGRGAKKLLKYMLKKHYIDYFGTDIHRIDKTYVIDKFPRIVKKIKKIIGIEYYQEIMDNANNLVK